MGKKVSNCKKIRLLLWKNFMLQCHEKNRRQLICEILVPVIFCVFLVLIRLAVEPKFMPERRFMSAYPQNTAHFENLTSLVPVLAYSPRNQFLENILRETLSFDIARLTSIQAYDNSRELQRVAAEIDFIVCVEFPDAFADLKDYPRKFEFSLRFPSVLRTYSRPEDIPTWKTNQLYTDIPNSGPRNAFFENSDGVPIGYFDEGFIDIQQALTMSYIKLAAQQDELPAIKMQRFPYPKYINDLSLEATDEILPMFLVLGFITATFNLTKYVALEKEKQLKEVMKIMGVPNWIHWTAWFLRSLIVWGITCIFLTVLFKLPVNNEFAVLTYCDAILLFLILLMYSIAVICFCFMMAVFFKKSTTAAAVTGFTFFLIFAPMTFVTTNYEQMNLLVKLLVCLNLNFAMPLAVRIVMYFETTQEGVQWSNLFEAINEDDNLTLAHILVMMLIAAGLYLLICLYFEQVFPGEFGVRKDWYFPFQRDFWCPNDKNRASMQHELEKEIPRSNPLAFEEEPKDKHAGVEIKSLGKRFKGKWAVKNLSLKMYEDEITVLLGHNGAGKTTTISMLTGMFSPTSGTAIINGYDIRTETDDARASMGICPQHNVLFDNMSVANHLIFFSKLKGLEDSEVKLEVDKFLEIIQLKPKANALSSTLSGGMKRKLSLCCALCGDTKVVFCDEPSSGMDPAARRQLWDLLQSEKMGRTVLLTTHFMDEADVLGDRIAIMCSGDLKCHGTSFFLKKKFGSGYRLTCVKADKCDVGGITKLLGKYIPNIQPESEIGTELTYRLPDKFSSVFGQMLKDLEKNMNSFGVNEFGLGVTSLEEVFLKIGAENADPDVLNLLSNESREADVQRRSGGQDEKPEKERRSTKKDKEKRYEKTVPKLRREEGLNKEEPLYDSDENVIEIGANKKKVNLAQDETPRESKSDNPTNESIQNNLFRESVESIRKILMKSDVSQRDISNSDKLGRDTMQSDATTSKNIPRADNMRSDATQEGNVPPKDNLMSDETRKNTTKSDTSSDENWKTAQSQSDNPRNDTTKRGSLKSEATEDNQKSDTEKRDESSKYNSLKKERENREPDRSVKENRKFLDYVETESQRNKNSKGMSLTCNHWHAMMYKKVIYTRRDIIFLLFQNLIAIIFVVLGMMAVRSFHLEELPPMTYNLKQYSKAVSVLEVAADVTPDSNERKIADEYLKSTNSYGSNYEMETTKGIGMEEYILKLGEEDIVRVTKLYLVGATIGNNEITGWYNNQPYHVTPLTLNMVHNAIARHYIGPDAEIIVTNHPLPHTEETRQEALRISLGGTFVVLLIGFGMAFVTAYYAIFLIKENMSKAKLLQFVGGVRSWTFWLTHFIWDYAMLIITAFIIIIIMKLFNVPEYSTFEILSYYLLLLLVFCFAALSLTYLLSTFYKESVTGFTNISIIYFFSGIVLVFGFLMLSQFITNKDMVDFLKYVFALFPHYSLTTGWMTIEQKMKFKKQCEFLKKTHPKEIFCFYFPECCKSQTYFTYGPDGFCTHLFAMLITGIFLLLFLIVRDYGPSLRQCMSSKKTNIEETEEDIDDDVKAERNRVMNMTKDEIATYNLVLDRVKKYYGKFYAVKGISLSVKGQECFGLLGINGAGKTTTFKMLTGDESISSGDAYVTGISIRTNLAGVYQQIGYCPQFDALLDDLTGRETLYIFCLLRGVPRNKITTVSEGLAEAFGFMKHIDKPTKAYSGGNKRKLSTALAVVGSPAVIYLDEPTSGMDPAAQRRLWNMVCLVRDCGKLIVLTTHSMGEVEALCTKVAIMVNGQFKCIGSTQHLKSKFSKGLVLKIQAERNTAASTSTGQRMSSEITAKTNDIKNAVLAQYPSAEVESEYQGMLTIYVPLVEIKWSEIFDWMEKNRTRLKIEDYSISQTTLEEVFLNFASKQETNQPQ